MILICTLIVTQDYTVFAFESDINIVENNIQSFIEETKELLLYNPEASMFTSSYEEKDSKKDIDFSSCRLIVKSGKKPDKLNSVGIADGYKDYYLVQFKNEADVRQAYDYYSKIKDMDVSVDSEIGTFTQIEFDGLYGETSSDADEMQTNSIDYDGVPDRLNSWGSEITGAYAVKDYLSNKHNSPQIQGRE